MCWAGEMTTGEAYELRSRHHIKQRTGVTVPGSHYPLPSCSGSAKNLPPPEEAGGAHSGFAIIIPSLPAKWRQVVFTGRRTLIILREAFGTWKLDEFMRSAAIFPRCL